MAAYSVISCSGLHRQRAQFLDGRTSANPHHNRRLVTKLRLQMQKRTSQPDLIESCSAEILFGNFREGPVTDGLGKYVSLSSANSTLVIKYRLINSLQKYMKVENNNDFS